MTMTYKVRRERPRVKDVDFGYCQILVTKPRANIRAASRVI